MENIKTWSSVPGLGRRFDPLNNFFFYKIFGEKDNEVQLLGFINAVLGRTGDDKFISVEILENSTFMADIMGGKSCSLDVRAKLPCGTMVDCEVQLRNQQNMDRRSLFYISKEFVRRLKSGDDYLGLENVIAINIIDYDFLETEKFHTCFRLREDTEHDIILTEALQVHFINMVKYRKYVKDKLNDPLCRWLTWFDRNSTPELLEEVVKMDTAIQTADSRMSYVIRDDEAMLAYDRYMKAACDRTAEINFARDEERKKSLKKLADKDAEIANSKAENELLRQRIAELESRK